MTTQSKIQITHSNGLPRFNIHCTLEEARKINDSINNSYMDSTDYKLRVAACAFLQGYREDCAGGLSWVFVEFWATSEDKYMPYVEYLRQEVFRE